MPKVSVIIPVYNVEKYLRECLDSAINQTLKDIEIICVDDGSTDNSGNILDEYASKDNRIKVIHKENSGVSSSRNIGLDIAKGEFIGFLDSDDYLDPNFYEGLYNKAKETYSDIAVCEYIYRFTDNGKKKLFLKVDKNVITTNAKEKFECLYLPYFCYAYNKIYKRDFLKERFIEGIIYEDVYFTTNVLANSGKMVVVPNITYYYRNNPKSLVNDKNNLNNHLYHSAMSYFYKFIHEQNIDLDVDKYCETKKYKFLGITFLKINKKLFKTEYNFMDFVKCTFPK